MGGQATEARLTAWMLQVQPLYRKGHHHKISAVPHTATMIVSGKSEPPVVAEPVTARPHH